MASRTIFIKLPLSPKIFRSLHGVFYKPLWSINLKEQWIIRMNRADCPWLYRTQVTRGRQICVSSVGTTVIIPADSYWHWWRLHTAMQSPRLHFITLSGSLQQAMILLSCKSFDDHIMHSQSFEELKTPVTLYEVSGLQSQHLGLCQRRH